MIHRIIQHQTANIHYFFQKNEASDELVIFLHGAYGDHTCFDGQAKAFTAHYNVIFFDLLGHGQSNVFTIKDRIDATPEQIKRILEVEKFRRAHLVGVSAGALLAQYVALKYPELVRSIVSTGGYNINRVDEAINKAQKESDRKCIWTGILSMDKLRRYAAGQAVLMPENKERYYRMAKRFIRKSFFSMAGMKNVVAERPDAPADYPLLILCGEYGIEWTKNAARRWHEQRPESAFHIISNAGQIANMDNPEEFNRLVLDFLLSLAQIERK